MNDATVPPLDVAVKHVGSVTVLSIRGEIDLATCPQLAESIDSVLTESHVAALIIDLTGVTFLASVGMTVLFETSRRLSSFGQFAVVADGPATRRPLTVMGLDQTFAIHADLDDALEALDS